MKAVALSDYSLIGQRSQDAVAKGLAEAEWYQSPISRDELRRLLERRDGPALRDTALWFGLIFLAGYLTVRLWGSWWAVLPYLVYCVLYGSTSDSRWHESSHGTAFKTDWLNNALYEIASFMVLRESVPWRWSHVRHHSDTIIVGRDPEIAVPRPPNLFSIAIKFFNIPAYLRYFRNVSLHCIGRLAPEEATYIPASEHPRVFRLARIYALIYAGVIGLCFYLGSVLPVMFVGLSNLFGAWLMSVYGYTQHAGLAEDVLDHRLNCRTVYMNRLNRFLYWNMNYHLEHHMFPLVPYHALPRLHELIKDDCPPAYRGLIDAYREIIPAVLRQVKDPGYFVKRRIPEPANRTDRAPSEKRYRSVANAVAGWVEVCPASALGREDVVRFDHREKTFAVYRLADGRLYATDGICTHGNTPLAGGLVKGTEIECPKHNGRFDVRDGSPRRAPVCVGLRTYATREQNGGIELDLSSAGGAGAAVEETTYRFRVVFSRNVATFIRELTLEPEADSPPLRYEPGQYLQFNIPAYGSISFSALQIAAPFDEVWRAGHVFDYRAENILPMRRNYSLASNPDRDAVLMLNIRIATPPRGQECNAGSGSTYMWSLRPGDRVTAIGPFGDFRIKPTDREMVYIGGGAGMAPLRSHISNLLETQASPRAIRYFYGARSRQELFYVDFFRKREESHPNFAFYPALSEPLPQDAWEGPAGYIHEVVRDAYLKSHPRLSEVEFYLCGPPPMIRATQQMLRDLGVRDDHVAFDEFT